MSFLSYQDSGVDIGQAETCLSELSDSLGQKNEVIKSPNDFAGLFALKNLLANYKDPVLVSSTDGVGTKLLTAIECENFDGLGQDLVAMCANDLLCKGAKPLFFLDYFATGHLKDAPFNMVLNGIIRALNEIDCALVGGETAEMPGLYQKAHFDLAGFIVGIAEREKLLGAHLVKENDAVIGLKSSGLHANGFSLVRKIVFEKLKLKPYSWLWQESGSTVAQELCRPTLLYHHAIETLKNAQVDLKALAHITGGGLLGNIPRILPQNLMAKLELSPLEILPIFKFLAERGPVRAEEMLKTFNMGIGMVLVINNLDKNKSLDIINNSTTFSAIELGSITKKYGDSSCSIKM